MFCFEFLIIQPIKLLHIYFKSCLTTIKSSINCDKQVIFEIDSHRKFLTSMKTVHYDILRWYHFIFLVILHLLSLCKQ